MTTRKCKLWKVGDQPDDCDVRHGGSTNGAVQNFAAHGRAVRDDEKIVPQAIDIAREIQPPTMTSSAS
jgi:hypothetical protein